MKSLILLGVGVATLASGPMKPGSSAGPMRPSGGTMGAYKPPPALAFPRPVTPKATPGVRMAPEPKLEQPKLFKPYEPKSVYSNRGGVDAYPKPMVPKTYRDPNAKPAF